MKYLVDMQTKTPTVYTVTTHPDGTYDLDKNLVISYIKARNQFLRLTEALEESLDEQHYWG